MAIPAIANITGGIGGMGGPSAEGRGGQGGLGEGPMFTSNYYLNPGGGGTLSAIIPGQKAQLQTVADSLIFPVASTQVFSESEVYCLQMLRQKRGFPLYEPAPQISLPEAYRARGISIGDVGSVTPDGIFDFFFNIFLSSEDPVNANETPEGFMPLAMYEPKDVFHLDYDPGSHVSTSTVARQDIGVSSDIVPDNEFTFRCDVTQGAVLALPHGTHLQKLRNVGTVQCYAARHAASWYEHINGSRGRELENGELYLVTGHEKTVSWGMASYYESNCDFRLNFRENADRYRWSGVVGQDNPSKRKCYNPSSTNDSPANHTVFLHGISISLKKSLWDMLFGTVSVETSSIPDFYVHFDRLRGFGVGSKRRSSWWPPLSWTASRPAVEPQRARSSQQATVTEFPPNPKIYNPGKLMNEYILSKSPDTNVALTHDDDWRDILGDMSDIQTLSDFLQQVDDQFTLSTENDATFLVSRTPSSPCGFAYSNGQNNVSTTTSSSPPSNPEDRELIRIATSMLCKEVVKPTVDMCQTKADLMDWEEVKMRVRALARLERIWGKSGVGVSSSDPYRANAEERERRLFTEALRDGFVLCQLMNKLRANSIVHPDVREDGLVRTSNITKFLDACSSYGLPREDLFRQDDFIVATGESLARVARTIIALIKYVDTSVPSNFVASAQQSSPYALTEGLNPEDLRWKADVATTSNGQETNLRVTFLEFSRAEEFEEAGCASSVVGGQSTQAIPLQERLDNSTDVRPIDTVRALPLTTKTRSYSSSAIPCSQKIDFMSVPRPRQSVRSLSQPHSLEAPVFLSKPDSLISRRAVSLDSAVGNRAILVRHSSHKLHQSGSLVSPTNLPERGNDHVLPFPRIASDQHSPAVSPCPLRASLSLSDKPRLPLESFSGAIEGGNPRRPRPSSYGELGALPSRSRSESVMDIGLAPDNPSASDLSRHSFNVNGTSVRQTLIVEEDGKPPTHLYLGNCIGRGPFGLVYRALNLNTGQMVAVKQIRLEGLKEDEVTTIMREVELVRSLSHPSIVKYEGMARDQDTLSIVLEYAENGSLEQTLKAFGKFNERLVASYVVKILQGLHYLHSCEVVHCDLKAANILTTQNGNVKLSDFGVSLNLRAMEREIKDVAGTPNWMAPEVIELKGASTKSDIWSLACTVIELLTGRPPYAEIANSMSVMFHIVEDDMPPLPEDCSPLLEDFLKQCFNKDPTKRPSAELLCEHRWLKENGSAHNELRPQDSIPFLQRVSADLQNSEPVHSLSQMKMPDTPGEPSSSGSPPSGRISFSSRPIDQDISREHSFVKTTFSKPMVCRVCLLNVRKSAVLCDQCSLIAHSKCAVNAPPRCDLRSLLLLDARTSAYFDPLDASSEPGHVPSPPIGPASEVAYVGHTLPEEGNSMSADLTRKLHLQKRLRRNVQDDGHSITSTSTTLYSNSTSTTVYSARSAASQYTVNSLDETSSDTQRGRVGPKAVALKLPVQSVASQYTVNSLDEAPPDTQRGRVGPKAVALKLPANSMTSRGVAPSDQTVTRINPQSRSTNCVLQ